MPKHLIFLHGKGGDTTAHRDFMEKLAAAYNARLICINAPLPYKNGFSWFDKQEQDGVSSAEPESFKNAADYVEKKIKELGLESKNIILCGHSQGGAVAVATGMRLPILGIISICGDWPVTIPITKTERLPKILWIEGGKDVYLSQYRKQSYLLLKEKGINVCFIYDAETEHNVFSSQLLEKIAGDKFY